MSGENIKKNIEANRKATQSSRYRKSGLTTRKTELSSKNFDKLMKQRGLSGKDTAALKASSDRSSKMQVRHAKKGESFVVTHGEQNASGVFVSKKSLGKTPEKRIDKGSLPHSNSAKYETKVTLDKNQNLVYGKIAPQSKFQKMDPKQAPRKGGGTQVITDGGYKSGAVRNSDPKYPVPAKSKAVTTSQSFKQSLASSKKTSSNSNGGGKSKRSTKGQSR